MGPKRAVALPDLQWVTAGGLPARVRPDRRGRAPGTGPAPPGRHPPAAPADLSSPYSRSVPIADRVAVRLRVNGEDMADKVAAPQKMVEGPRGDVGIPGPQQHCSHVGGGPLRRVPYARPSA